MTLDDRESIVIDNLRTINEIPFVPDTARTSAAMRSAWSLNLVGAAKGVFRKLTKELKPTFFVPRNHGVWSIRRPQLDLPNFPIHPWTFFLFGTTDVLRWSRAPASTQSCGIYWQPFATFDYVVGFEAMIPVKGGHSGYATEYITYAVLETASLNNVRSTPFSMSLSWVYVLWACPR